MTAQARSWRRVLGFAVACNLAYPAFPPHGLWWLAWVAFVPFFAVLDACERLRSLVLVTLAWAACGYIGGYPWIAGTLVEFGKLSPLAAWPALGLFAVIGATTLLPFVILRRWWLARGGAARHGAILVVAGLWLGMELWYPRLFPWYVGLTQASVPAARQVADLGGMPAISLLVILVNLVIYELVRAWRAGLALPKLEAAIALAIVGLGVLYGAWRSDELATRLASAPTMRIALVQGDVDNATKTAADGGGDPAAESVLVRYARLTSQVAREHPDLIVWPETAFPNFVTSQEPLPDDAAADDLERTGRRRWAEAERYLESVARMAETPILTGGNEAVGRPHEHGGDINYNAAILVRPGARITTYRKIVLIPFGETLPWPIDVLFPSLYQRMPRRFRFSPGDRRDGLEVGRHRIAACICYEAILADLCRDLVCTSRAEVLVNLTNDSWFGDSGEPEQHLAMSALRAVELRIPLVRATNSGISALVDQRGALHDPTPLFTAATRIYDVPLLPDAGATFFARAGDLPLSLYAGVATLMAAGRRVRRRA